MSIRSILVVAMALVFGVSAAAGVNMMVNGNRNAAPQVDTVSVVVAALDIPRGATINADLVKTWDYPRNMVPPGAVTKLSDAIDRAVLTPLVKDEPLLDGKISKKGAGRGMAALIPKGMRAITIQTPNVASGVAGFVMPGNKVDILLTVTDGNDKETGGGSTTTLLQNVEILAVDQKIDASANYTMDLAQLRSVTLLVTPDQAALLDLGQNKGLLHLSLRNLEDDRAADTRPATLAGIRYRQERPWDERAKGVLATLGQALAQRRAAPQPAPQPAPRPTRRNLVVVHGLQRTEQFARGQGESEKTELAKVIAP